MESGQGVFRASAAHVAVSSQNKPQHQGQAQQVICIAGPKDRQATRGLGDSHAKKENKQKNHHMDREVIRTTAPTIIKRVRSSGNLFIVAITDYLEKSGTDG